MRTKPISICWTLPYVLVDYSKCTGDGACTTTCPNSAFERLGNWCKPKDSVVKNSAAIECFYEHVLSSLSPVPAIIRYHVPECYLCWQCIGACPNQAIDVEYDDLDIREILITPKATT
jgi:NAD-dependent dihydropyrimidine dehydrogenase PreA subunit